MKRQADGAGYYINDERASGDGVDEADVLTCPHCEKIIKLQDWRKEREQGGGGWCRKCQAPVCGPCLDRMLVFGCEPWLKRIDRAFEENYRRAQNRKVLGI